MSDTRTDELSRMLGNPPESEEENVEEEEEQNGGNAEEENAEAGAEENDETDENEEEEENENNEEDDEEESEQGQNKGKGKKQIKNPDRWHGKSREEVIQAYEDLEGSKNNDGTVDKKEAKKQADELGIEMPSEDELSKMSPKQFVQYVLGEVSKQVKNAYENRAQISQTASQEIKEAQRNHPLLKSSPEYREHVLALIGNAAQQGQTLELEDACKRVDSLLGVTKGEEQDAATQTRRKKVKASVEKGGGGASKSSGKKGTEDERLENVFGSASNNTSLGGLGV